MMGKPECKGPDAPAGGIDTLHFNPSFFSKTKQCFPVERKTSADGRFLHFIPNTVHALGKDGSHVILKFLH